MEIKHGASRAMKPKRSISMQHNKQKIENTLRLEKRLKLQNRDFLQQKEEFFWKICSDKKSLYPEQDNINLLSDGNQHKI